MKHVFMKHVCAPCRLIWIDAYVKEDTLKCSLAGTAMLKRQAVLVLSSLLKGTSAVGGT